MQDFFNSLMQHDSIWIVHVFLVVLVTACFGLVAHLTLNYFHHRTSQTRTVWDDAALSAARSPVQVLLWVVGIDIASRIIHKQTGSEIFEYASDIRALLVIVVVAWFLLRFIRKVEQEKIRLAEKDPALDLTSTTAIAKLLRITVIITASLMLLEKLGYSISGVLAFGGIGGIAVGFAAKDMLANFFGGLMIFLDRPFSIGDWIRSPDRDIEGTVEHIGWRLTIIRTFDKRPLYVPNATFMSVAVENPSRMSHRRINETIGVRYDDWQKIPAIVANVKAMVMAHEGIAQDQTVIVNFNKYNASSLDLLVYVFTRTREWVPYHEVKQDVLFRIMEIITAHGAEVAFPTRTLHMAAPADGDGAAENPEARR